MKGFILIMTVIAFVLTSCDDISEDFLYTEIDIDEKLAERAYSFAELYAQSETEYKLGGQDAVRAIQIDCSGLVIMCYKYALVDTKYELIVSDMTANYIYRNSATIIPKEMLRKGDLIFMGEEESELVTHIALYEKNENGNIFFIDSTQKDTDGDGIYDINGVSHRYYSDKDKRFKAFGIMRVKY